MTSQCLSDLTSLSEACADIISYLGLIFYWTPLIDFPSHVGYLGILRMVVSRTLCHVISRLRAGLSLWKHQKRNPVSSNPD